MKIYQIISENRVINESKFSWLDDTYKWLKGFTKAGKEAERIAKEIEYLAPGIDKAAEKYADMVTRAREEFKKPPGIDFFLRQTVPNWASRVPDEQEAIKQALMNATKSKLAEREAAKTAAKNPQAPAPTTQQTPPAKQQKKQNRKQEAQPTQVHVVEAEKIVNSKPSWIIGMIRAAGFIDITYNLVSDWLYYSDLYKAGEITEEELGVYHRGVGEQFVLRLLATGFLTAAAGKMLGAVGKAVGVSPNAGSIPFFGWFVDLLKTVWPERVTQLGGRIMGEASAMIIAHWLMNNKEHQKNVAWLIWDYIDPAVVGGYNLGKRLVNSIVPEAKLEMSRLLDEIEAAKQQAPNTSQPATPPAPAAPGGQSGQEVAPNTGGQDTSPSRNANPAPARPKIDSATGNDPDSDDAWNRLLNYK